MLLRSGFITRQISWWLNIAGLVTIGLMGLYLCFQRSWILILSLVAVAVTHGFLMYRHSQLEALLDPAAMSVLDPQRFAVLHENYEFLSGCQWLAAMIYLGGLLRLLAQPAASAECDRKQP